jgi:allantoinase
VTRWLCANPARQVSLAPQKGSIAVGSHADLVIWNPDQEFRVDASSLHHRHKITPYEGEVLSGAVLKTFLRGRQIYDMDHFTNEPFGHMLLRKN